MYSDSNPLFSQKDITNTRRPRLDDQVLLADQMTTFPSDQPAPPNQGQYNSRTAALRTVNFSRFARTLLISFLSLSSIVCILYLFMFLYGNYKTMIGGFDTEYQAREALRYRDGITSVMGVEHNTLIGSKSSVLGSQALDQSIFSNNYPFRQSTTQDDDLKLRISILKGNEKILYQSLDNEGIGVLQQVFGTTETDINLMDEMILGQFTTHRHHAIELDPSKPYLMEDAPEMAIHHHIKDQININQKSPAVAVPNSDVVRANNEKKYQLQMRTKGLEGSLRFLVLKAATDPVQSMESQHEITESITFAKLGMFSLSNVLELVLLLHPEVSLNEACTRIFQPVTHCVACWQGDATSEPKNDPCYAVLSALPNPPKIDCHPSECPDVSSAGSVRRFLPLVKLYTLPLVSETARLLDEFDDSRTGMTAGQQIKLAQVNSAKRVDSLWAFTSWQGRITFALTIITLCHETMSAAYYMLNVSVCCCSAHSTHTN